MTPAPDAAQADAMVMVPLALMQAIAEHLSHRPFREVAGLIGDMQRAVAISQAAASERAP